MNLLHRFSVDFFPAIAGASSWSTGEMLQEEVDRMQWVKARLLSISQTCEDLLLRGARKNVCSLAFNPDLSSSTTDDISHDVHLSAAMLLVVISNLTESSSGFAPSSNLIESSLSSSGGLALRSNFTESSPSLAAEIAPGAATELMIKRWFSLPNLSHFSKLSLCYALLAKIPSAVMAVSELDGGPLILALFPIVCQLFEG